MDIPMMDRFADPELFQTLTLGEKLQGAGITTLMGMGITFVVLIFLWALIAQMAKFSKPESKPPAPGAGAAASGAPAAAAPKTPAGPVQATAAEESGQLVAVISAALAAFQTGTGAGGGLIIRKISRVSGPTPSWFAAGSADAIDSRRF